MKEQNFANHKQIVKGYHIVIGLLTIFILLASLYNLVNAIKYETDIMYALMFLAVSFIFLLQYYYNRAFALKAQDRAIRAEENLRHFVLTGKLLDPKLTVGQITALRFAHDEEFLSLSQKAATENLKSQEIKKLIKNWKGDYDRA